MLGSGGCLDRQLTNCGSMGRARKRIGDLRVTVFRGGDVCGCDGVGISLCNLALWAGGGDCCNILRCFGLMVVSARFGLSLRWTAGDFAQCTVESF